LGTGNVKDISGKAALCIESMYSMVVEHSFVDWVEKPFDKLEIPRYFVILW